MALTSKSRNIDRLVTRAGFQLESAVDSVPLAGCPSNDFVAKLVVGGQELDLLVDTGSTTMAVASVPCTTCAGVHARYIPGSTATNQQVAVSATYGDGSGWFGSAYMDQVAFPGLPSVAASFVSIASATGFFTMPSCPFPSNHTFWSGILGLAYPSLALPPTSDVRGLMYQANVFYQNLFAIMMCSVTGRLWLGGWNESVSTGADVVYTPIVQKLYYKIIVTDVLVGGKSLGFTPNQLGATIVDSGSTLWSMPTDVYNAFVAALNADVGFVAEFGTSYWSNGVCVQNVQPKDVLNLQLPHVAINVSGSTTALVLLPIASYLIPVPGPNGVYFYCPGVSPLASSSGDAVQAILGWAVMNQFVTIFDVANSRVGFAPLSTTACSSNTNETILLTGFPDTAVSTGLSSGSAAEFSTTFLVLVPIGVVLVACLIVIGAYMTFLKYRFPPTHFPTNHTEPNDV